MKSSLKRDGVPGVAGAFLVRGLLDKNECAAWRTIVDHEHDAYEEELAAKAAARRSSQHHLPI